MGIFTKFLYFIGTNQSYWQILKYLQTTFCCSSSSSYRKYHWSQFLWNRFLKDFFPNSLKVFICFRNIKIFIRAISIKEWSTITHLHDIFSKSFEKINSPCYPSIFSKSDESTVILICNFFIIYQSDFLFKNFI
jgi:hypothetical protein